VISHSLKFFDKVRRFTPRKNKKEEKTKKAHYLHIKV
jgi:hypothetical protein